MLPATATAQDDMEFQFESWFPADSSATVHQNFGVHGIAVDSSGKIWVQGFYARGEWVTPAGDTVATMPLFVFNPDGTQADFSPIHSVTVGADVDTLNSGGRGLATDHQGNVLAAFFDTIYRFNAETGEGMAKLTPTEGASLTRPAVTDLGNVVVSYVVAGNPIQVWDPTLNTIVTTVTDSRESGFARTLAVSGDGNDVYQPIYTSGGGVIHYHSDQGVFGTYAIQDTLLKGFSPESSTVGPDGNLWASTGSYADTPNNYPGVDTDYPPAAWYGLNTETGAFVDSFRWNRADELSEDPDVGNVQPRAIAFSKDGDVAYVGNFYPFDAGVQKFVLVESDAVQRPAGIPEALTLSENYPNPFSQSTRISFGVHKTGKVTLKVYDVLGREVRTLIDRVMPVGENHTVDFQAGNLPAGVYFYQLRTEGHQLSGKMLLVK